MIDRADCGPSISPAAHSRTPPLRGNDFHDQTAEWASRGARRALYKTPAVMPAIAAPQPRAGPAYSDGSQDQTQGRAQAGVLFVGDRISRRRYRRGNSTRLAAAIAASERPPKRAARFCTAAICNDFRCVSETLCQPNGCVRITTVNAWSRQTKAGRKTMNECPGSTPTARSATAKWA